MCASQKYVALAARPMLTESVVPVIGQTVQSERLTAKFALLRAYLDEVFYPFIFPVNASDGEGDASTPKKKKQSDDLSVDLGDLNIDLDLGELGFEIDFDEPSEPADDEACAYYTPQQRVLMLHKVFVTICGPRQAEWYWHFIEELIHFFGQCGETELIVQLTLREPRIMAYLRPYCS